MDEKQSSITLEYILLGLLAEHPDHGYALFEKVKDTPELSLIWQVKRSKLYYLLDKLAGEGLLSFTIRAQEGYPDRKIYQLTDEGTAVFNEWLLSPVLSSRYVRIAFLSKLYFSLQEEHEKALRLIDAQHEICLGWLSALAAEQELVDKADFISNQVYHFRSGQITAMIAWLEDCREKIQT